MNYDVISGIDYDAEILSAMHSGNYKRVVELFAQRVGRWPLSDDEIDEAVKRIQTSVRLPPGISRIGRETSEG